MNKNAPPIRNRGADIRLGANLTTAEMHTPIESANTLPRQQRRGIWSSTQLLRALLPLACMVTTLIACSQKIDPEKIPPVPDLSQSAPPLAEAVRQADAAAHQDLKTSVAIGDLGRLYHANHFYTEAAQCYDQAIKMDPKEPRWPYLLADVLQSSGAEDRIPALLESALALSPDYVPARIKLGDLYFKRADLTRAAAQFEKARDISPENPHVLFGLGRVALEQGNAENARDLLRQATTQDPDFSTAFRLLASSEEKLGRSAQADSLRELARGLTRFTPPEDPWLDELVALCFDPSFLLAMADRSIQQGKTSEAGEMFRRAVSIEPNNPQIHAMLGRKLYRAGRPADAIASLRRAIELEPKDVDSRVELASYLSELNRVDEAEAMLTEALAIDPRSELGHAELGKLRQQQGRSAEAIREFEAALDVNPGSAEALVNLGFLRYEAGNRSDAVRSWESALKTDPLFAKAHFGLGLVRAEEGDPAKAIEHFSRAVRRNPDYFAAHFQLVRLYGQLLEQAAPADKAKWIEKARHHANEAVRIDGTNRETRRLSLLLAARMKDSDAVVAELAAAPQNAVDDPLRLEVAAALIENGGAPAATTLLRDLSKRIPASFTVNELLGIALLRSGSAVEAIPVLESALQIDGTKARTHYHLAGALDKAGRPREAVGSYERAIALDTKWVVSRNALAWMLATHPDASVRNADRAVTLAERVCMDTKNTDPILLDTLAAAYAAAGQFERALETSDRALKAAVGAEADLVSEMQQRRALYASGKAYVRA